MNYKGVIIKESLETKDILGRIKVLLTKVEQVAVEIFFATLLISILNN